MSFVGPVISALGSVIGSAAGFGSQYMANQQSMDVARYQNDWNLMMWKLNNKYNSPLEQMKRLKEAGLNPSLVYGSGNVGGNASSIPPQAAGASIGAYTNFGDFGASAGVDTYMRMKLLESDLQSKEVERGKMAAETGLLGARAAGEGLENSLRQLRLARTEQEREFWSEDIKANLKLKLASIRQMTTGADLNVAREQNVYKDTELKLIEIGMTPYRIREVLGRIANLAAQNGLIHLQGRLVGKQIEKTDYEIGNLILQGDSIVAGTMSKNADTNGKQLSNIIRQALYDKGVPPDANIIQQLIYLFSPDDPDGAIYDWFNDRDAYYKK